MMHMLWVNEDNDSRVRKARRHQHVEQRRRNGGEHGDGIGVMYDVCGRLEGDVLLPKDAIEKGLNNAPSKGPIARPSCPEDLNWPRAFPLASSG